MRDGAAVIDRDEVLARCAALPQAALGFPFGEDTAVFTVGGRVFALVDLAGEHDRVSVKADPDYAAALVREHPQVVPGYHLNKRHWITIGLGGAPGAPEALPAGLVEECVDESYDLVVAGLPARLRPSRDG